MPDNTADQVAAKSARLDELRRSTEAERALLAAHAWCAAFVAPKTAHEPSITTAIVRQLLDNDSEVPADVIPKIRRLADEYGFLHPHLAFPGVFAVPEDPENAENRAAGWNRGFDVVLGNPPWKVSQLSEKAYFAARDSTIADLPGAKRKQAIDGLRESNPALWHEYRAERRRQDAMNALIRGGGRYPLAAFGKLNSLRSLCRSNARLDRSHRSSRSHCAIRHSDGRFDKGSIW